MGRGYGSKWVMRDIINIWKIKRNSNPAYIIYLLTNLYNILENTYSVSGIEQIKKAVNEIGSKPKADAGTIFIEAGTHEITETINLANTGSMVIYGHGDNTILKPADGIPIFNITNVASILFKNLKLDLSNYTGDTQGIIANELSNHHIFFENVTIIGNGANGIGIELQSGNCIIENCNITLVNIGINILSKDNLIDGNIVNSNASYGIQVGANSNSIYFNTCSNNRIGIYLNSANYNLIDGNYCENNTNWGIYLNDSNFNAINNYCLNNDGNSASPTGGIGIDGNSDNNILIKNTSIDNNNIGAGDGYGLYLGVNTDNNYILANYLNGNDNNFLDLGTNYTYSIVGHTHDGETVLIDGINSNGGIFSFLTTGQVNFNQNVSVPNLITAGNVDGVDVSVLKDDVDGFPDELKNLIQAEIQQLENINTKIISNTQWGYLSVLNQNLRTTDNVSFNTITLTAGGVIVGTVQLTDSIWKQLVNIGVITISATQWGYLGGLDQALAKANSPTFGGLTLNGILNMSSHLIKNVLDPVDNQDSATKNYVLSRLLNTAFSSNWSGIEDKAVTADKVYDQFVEVADEITALKYCLNFEGTWNASLGTPPSATPSDGDYWIVTTGGTWNGVVWELLDWIVWEATTEKWYKVKYFRQFPVVEVSGNDSIQSAIDQVIYMGGGVVMIHSGTFNNSNDTFPLTINDSGNGYFLKIMGIGDSAIIDPNGDSTIFNITNIGKLILEDFKINATDLITAGKEIINVAETNNNPITIHSITIIGDGINGYGIEVNSDNCIIEDCDISSINIGINILGNDNTIRDNIINSCNSYGIQIKGNNNSFYNNETDNNAVGIYLDTADYNQINGHYIEGNTLNGIHLNGSNYNSISNNSIIGNDSNTANPQAGVYIDSDSNDNDITENSILNNNNAGAGIGYGIYIANANCDKNIVKNNQISGNDVSWKDNGINTDIEYICSTAQDIQDAINSIGAKSGTITILSGNITVATTININGGGDYIIEGEGEGTILTISGVVSCFYITSAKSCILKDFKIDINSYTSVLQYAIHINEVSNHKVICQNLHIYGDGTNGTGIWNQSDKCEVITCTFINIGIGVYIVDGDYCFATRNYGNGLSSALIVIGNVGGIASNNIAVSCGMSVNTDNATYFILEGNIARSCVYGIRIVTSSYGIIEGNNISGSTFDGIELSSNSDRNLISDNMIISNGAWGIDIAVGCDYNKIGVNHFYNNASGEILDNGTGTIIIKGMPDVKTLNAPERFSTSNTYVKAKEILIQETGTFTFYWQYKADGGTAYSRLYKNDVAVGVEKSTTSLTYVDVNDTISVVAGDLIQIYHHTTVSWGVRTRNFYVEKLGNINWSY